MPVSSRLVFLLGTLAGLPIVLYAGSAAGSLLRRRWQALAALLGLTFLSSMIIAAAWLWADMRKMAAIEHYDRSSGYLAAVPGAYRGRCPAADRVAVASDLPPNQPVEARAARAVGLTWSRSGLPCRQTEPERPKPSPRWTQPAANLPPVSGRSDGSRPVDRAHGSRETSANDDLHELAARLAAAGEHPIVVACFLELAEPDITTGSAQCKSHMVPTRVLMVPYFLSAGVHLRRDLHRQRGRALQRCHPRVEFSPGRRRSGRASLAGCTGRGEDSGAERFLRPQSLLAVCLTSRNDITCGFYITGKNAAVVASLDAFRRLPWRCLSPDGSQNRLQVPGIIVWRRLTRFPTSSMDFSIRWLSKPANSA